MHRDMPTQTNRRSLLTTYRVDLGWRVLFRSWAWGGVPVVSAMVCHWAEHFADPSPPKAGSAAEALNVALGGMVLLIVSGVTAILCAMWVEAGTTRKIAVPAVYVVAMLVVCPIVGGLFFFLAVFSHGP
jgi:hypothetical protein